MILENAASSFSEYAEGYAFVDENSQFVFFSDLDNTRQFADFTGIRVYTFDDEEFTCF